MTPRKADIDRVLAAPMRTYPETPEDVLAWAAKQRDKHGVRLLWKSPGTSSWSPKRAVVLDRESWDAKELIDQAALMVHELIHALRSFSRVWYLLSARTRWVEETIAYREQARAYRAMGLRYTSIREWATTIVGKYAKRYSIRGNAAADEAMRQIMRGVT